MQVFEYTVWLDEKRDKEGDVTEQAEIIVPVTQVLARDAGQAGLLAAKKIPDEYLDGKIDRVQVVVRPFSG
jgi:hypothetical protein